MESVEILVPGREDIARLSLISRRATGRVGTRYHSRGIDGYGHVSNFVETEQILQSGGQVASFVQVRGSIPLYWRQNVNLRYSPPLEFYKTDHETSVVFKAHFEELISRYGPDVIALNLINGKGWEGLLENAFARQIGTLADSHIHYIHFDFNQQCHNMHWENIQGLIEEMQDDLLKQGHLFIEDIDAKDINTAVKSRQQGIVRTNCIDCLDRTNVLQSALALFTADHQLRLMGLLGRGETIVHLPNVHQAFRSIWADHADAISTQYSGTGALKTDLTR